MDVMDVMHSSNSLKALASYLAAYQAPLSILGWFDIDKPLVLV